MTQISASSVGSRSAVRHLTVRIKRYDPERDEPPRWQEFKIDANPMDRVLDVLQAIQWNQDESLALRRSCAHGVCGSDAMRINGANALACKVLMRDLLPAGKTGRQGKPLTITVEP